MGYEQMNFESENVTSAQLAYIAKLKTVVGETRYQRVKRELGISQNAPAPSLSKNQAAHLIRKLILAKNRGRRR